MKFLKVFAIKSDSRWEGFCIVIPLYGFPPSGCLKTSLSSPSSTPSPSTSEVFDWFRDFWDTVFGLRVWWFCFRGRRGWLCVIFFASVC